MRRDDVGFPARWLLERNVPLELVGHAATSFEAGRVGGRSPKLGEVSPELQPSVLPKSGLAHALVPESAHLREAALKLSVPLAYFARPLSIESGDATITAFVPGDAQEPQVMTALGNRLQAWGEQESSALFRHDEVVWDDALLRFPSLFFVGPDPTHSYRVDSRYVRRLQGLVRAPLFARPVATEGSPSAYDVLLERGFIDRVTDEDRCRALLARRDVAAYIGFDPTADSLHVGSLEPIMALAHLRRAGLRPIAVVGGATALVGDPSGKTEMRKMLIREEIQRNGAAIRRQIERFVSPGGGESSFTLLDNADWLLSLSYIDFLREVGVHFSVNRMLTAESFRARLEKEQGLSFLEFNYMCLQAYDFVHLARTENCLVQMGGSDQWGNIVAGVDLARRTIGKELSGVTFPLLMSASGRKFGKTESGNVWLDAARTPPHELFQFWRNTDDADVERFLCLFTFLPVEAISALVSGGSAGAMNLAKKVLAFAVTKLAHGDEAAIHSLLTAEALFGDRSPDLPERLATLGLIGDPRYMMALLGGSGYGGGFVSGSASGPGTGSVSDYAIPTLDVRRDDVEKGYLVIGALVELGLASSKGEARRLIQQGGVTVGEERVTSVDAVLPAEKLAAGELLIRVGKKKHGRIRLAE